MEKIYPFKDDLLGFWVYDKLPENMRQATPADIYPDQMVIYQAEIGSYKGLYITEKIRPSSVQLSRRCAAAGKLYVKK